MGQLAPPPSLPAAAADVWREIIDLYGDGAETIIGPDLEAYCGQVAILREARRRIDEEGLITADPKGNPIPHPAIAIERAAQVEVRAWGNRFKRRSHG